MQRYHATSVLSLSIRPGRSVLLLESFFWPRRRPCTHKPSIGRMSNEGCRSARWGGTMTAKPAKGRHGHTKRKRSNAQRAPRQASPFVGDLQAKLDACTRQLNEVLEREKATAEVLRIVSSSPGDLEAVFRNLLGNATRLCVA